MFFKDEFLSLVWLKQKNYKTVQQCLWSKHLVWLECWISTESSCQDASCSEILYLLAMQHFAVLGNTWIIN